MKAGPGPRNTRPYNYRIDRSMRPLKTLYRGFDRLEVAYQGALNPNDLEILEKARKEAERSHESFLAFIGPGQEALHIAETGLKGGYAFRGDTGPEGEVWFFK